LVLDSQDRVLYSSTKDLNKLDPLPDARASYYGMASTNHTRASSSIGRTRDDSELVSYQVTDIGWQIIATRPLQPIYQAAYGEFRLLLILMLATVLSAALLSMAIARRVRQPLHTLTEAVRALDLDGSEAQITAPPNAPVEIRDLFGHLATVSQRLQSSYRQLMAASEAGRHYREQLEQTLARRENEIQSRTRELEDTNDKLRTLSNIDELTGLANRRHFLETMDRAWRHGLRENEPVSVIIIDIDHFKAYNDHYGHLGGDQCLQRVADAMAGVVGRSLDIVARCGGEEFMIVLGGTGLDGALVLGERVRQLIEDLAIPHLGSVTDSILTVSVGVASTTPVRGSDYDDLIRAADQALYHAKNDGRNRVGRSDGDGVSIFVADAAAFDFNDHIDLRPMEEQ
ncbi:MAG: diguanylate cyclase, partial [Gammaproteobacteria bacterium]|nr:diguanylate cyclase [Gammaproteobacteria bacterium]